MNLVDAVKSVFRKKIRTDDLLDAFDSVTKDQHDGNKRFFKLDESAIFI